MPLDIPEWVVYPDDDWASITPKQAGVDPEALRRFVESLNPTGANFGGEDHTGGNPVGKPSGCGDAFLESKDGYLSGAERRRIHS